MGEKVAIIGSREWADYEMVRDYVESLDEDDTVVSGGARGVDQLAQIYAEDRGLNTIIFPADWNQHGVGAGLLRNQDIVAKADRVVAFWDGVSPGTQYSLDLARRAGKPVLVFRPSGFGPRTSPGP